MGGCESKIIVESVYMQYWRRNDEMMMPGVGRGATLYPLFLPTSTSARSPTCSLSNSAQSSTCLIPCSLSNLRGHVIVRLLALSLTGRDLPNHLKYHPHGHRGSLVITPPPNARVQGYKVLCIEQKGRYLRKD